MIKFLLSLFTEKKCFSCQQLWHFFCLKCSRELQEYKPYCYVCKKHTEDFIVHKECQKYFSLKQVIVFTRYRNTGIKRLLRHAKYYNKYLAYSDIIRNHKSFFYKFIEKQDSIFVPVPMHYLRKWKRWYNHSEIIAKEIWDMCQIPVNNNFIRRIRSTKQQSHLSRSERIHNLDNAFKLQKAVEDRNIIIYLVDDVVSTGSTLQSIAEYLEKSWYKDIRAVVLASD